MSFVRQSPKLLSLALSVAALAAPASALVAQGRPLFEWRGRVDREVRITMRGREAWVRSSDRGGVNSRIAVSTALPERAGMVAVRLENGRGDADVIQQPSSRNNYTAIVRIRDRSSGSERHRISAYWMPYGANGGWDDRDRRRDDDDRWDPRDRDRDGRGNGGWGNGGRGNGDRGRDSRFERTALRWSGDVDDGLEIRIQGDRIDYRTLSGRGLRNVRADFVRGGIPRDYVDVQVEGRGGRGTVQVIQQPSARNNYTTVIRVYDRQSGYGRYDFDVTFRTTYARR